MRENGWLEKNGDGFSNCFYTSFGEKYQKSMYNLLNDQNKNNNQK